MLRIIENLFMVMALSLWYVHRFDLVYTNLSWVINHRSKGIKERWQIDGKTMETMRDFIFSGSKITADGDYSHEIKRRLFPESYNQPR